MKDIRWSKETDLNYEGNKSIEKWKRYNGKNFETFQRDLVLALMAYLNFLLIIFGLEHFLELFLNRPYHQKK